MKIIEKEFNALTGEETITERDETAAEKKAREKIIADNLVFRAEAEANAQAKATAKAALLEQLGITEEQAKLLLS
jgi:hypothetical protein